MPKEGMDAPHPFPTPYAMHIFHLAVSEFYLSFYNTLAI